MEENIAILMADLSGYTALTETHGSLKAADLIDKYLAIVKNCLVGDSRLHERTGDEVMIVSTSPDYLLATSLMIMKETSGEENFLQVHGGLHLGKTLKRNNSYFGSAINLASRIAAKANPGTFLCSEEFVTSLSGGLSAGLTPAGKHSFKNISEKKEMFEIRNENKNSFFIDPVCRMLVLDTSKATQHPGADDIFFCSPACLDIYTRNEPGNSAIH
ncbi:MAG: adenylate/guanylate cyclase domain-containing protein [Bacteroidota bacterium]